MDNLFEQMANISKAHAYDIIAAKCNKLENILMEISKLIDDPDIEAIRHKAIYSEFDQLLIKIKTQIKQSYFP